MAKYYVYGEARCQAARRCLRTGVQRAGPRGSTARAAYIVLQRRLHVGRRDRRHLRARLANYHAPFARAREGRLDQPRKTGPYVDVPAGTETARSRDGLAQALFKGRKGETLRADIPQFFRMNLEVADLDAAISFYTHLLGIEGRKQAGS